MIDWKPIAIRRLVVYWLVNRDVLLEGVRAHHRHITMTRSQMKTVRWLLVVGLPLGLGDRISSGRGGEVKREPKIHMDLLLAVGPSRHPLQPQPGDEKRNASQTEKLFPEFDPSKATGVEISRTNSYIGAERANDRWQMTKPVYPAQATGIEELLQSLALLPKYDQISAKEILGQKGGLATFGLQPPNATIFVQSGTNRLGVSVGSRTLTGNRLYVQLAGDSGIHVTDARILDRLPASAYQWRNPLLVHEERLLLD